MIKVHLIYLTVCSLAHAGYIGHYGHISRMALNRRPATAFRPGVMLRPWTHPRFMATSHRGAPYVVYRNPQHRYAMKHFNPTTRNAYPGTSPWKTTRLPTSVTSEREFVRAASAPLRADGGTGAIHTIPAPNLSLSEKPIVVIEADNVLKSHSVTSEAPRPTYEVTEKYPDQSLLQLAAKIEQPIGFSKATSLTTPEFQALVRNGAALQLASELGLSAIALPQHAIPQPIQIPQQTILSQQSILPQQFTVQGIAGIQNSQELIHAGPEGIIISPNALYQPDPAFIQKLQNQLLHRFPGVEFVPYAADLQPQMQIQAQPQSQAQPHPPPQSQVFLLENEQVTKLTPSSFVVSDSHNKNIVQRETEEAAVVTLIPQELIVTNVTENQIEVTSAQPQNITVELIAEETRPATTTVKHVETSTEDQRVTPIYYAQVGQSIGNVVANGFYSAINDVRAAAVLAQVEKPQEPTVVQANLTTSTIKPELKTYFVQKPEKDDKNQTVAEIKPLLGVPFGKTPDNMNVAYTLLRADDKEPKVTKDGTVYAGQIVEATISEDQDFNKEKANILSRRAPIRLFAVTEKKEAASTTNAPQKVAMVKAKIPPRSKLTFDDKTGEPVLRIYASYVDNPVQKEIITTKLANMKREAVTRKQDTMDNWKSATVKAVDKTQGFDGNQVTQFGLKLRSRSDDYIPLFEDYEE